MRSVLAALAAAMLCGACATRALAIDAPPIAPGAATIVLMPPDAAVNFITLTEADEHDAWSAAAQANLMAALRSEISASGHRVAELADAPDSGQAALLQQTVLEALRAHIVFIDRTPVTGALPHQRRQPERYNVGQSLRESAPGADYALFVGTRTAITSFGLYAAETLTGSMTAYVPNRPRDRRAFAALVEVSTGDVVWVRRVESGDPRDPGEAASIARRLWRGNPLAPP